MESELSAIPSAYFNTNRFKTQLALIEHASEEAQRKIDYVTAHDEETLHAIHVIEEFLKRKHRLCYGGQAINAYLPAPYKFYNPELSIPDYDFFTPTQYQDVDTMVKDLKRAGFLDISVREGMHEGTMKIYVNYVPVADVTAIDATLYSILSKRETRVNGISYLDANTLRMLMYLELSRPRGEVGRWSKVYERLVLFNEFVPVPLCRENNVKENVLTAKEAEYTMTYLLQKHYVFAGADLVPFYKNTVKKHPPRIDWILHSTQPILFFSPDSVHDAAHLMTVFKDMRRDLGRVPSEDSESRKPRRASLTVRTYASHGVDLLPSMKVILRGKEPLVFIIDQTGCHSYYNVPLKESRDTQRPSILKIASMDTLITLYFCMSLMKQAYLPSIDCLANQLVHLSRRARLQGSDFVFPFISIKCAGHQTTMPSLIRSKVERTTAKKARLRSFFKKGSMMVSARKTLRTRITPRTRTTPK